jgi:transmembrane sensor
MSQSFESERNRQDGENQAAAWAWRLDRGLSAEEQDALFDWLAEDPSHAGLLSRQKKVWKRLDSLSAWHPEHSSRPNPDLLAPKPKPGISRLVWFSMAAAAALVVGFFLFQEVSSSRSTYPISESIAEAKPEIRNLLEDGSTVKLKEGAEVTVHFSVSERRVRLEKGEAFFIVAKDPRRPFVVEVQGVDVSAIGTAFNVRLGVESVEVLVAEGIVQVASSSDDGVSPELNEKPRFEAHQRAIISLSSRLVEPQVAVLSKAEIQRVLAWQHGAMTFAAKPLAEIIDELNRLNETQLTIVDPDLASERFTGTFLSSNVEGFVSVLKNGYGVNARMRGSSEILLSKSVE